MIGTEWTEETSRRADDGSKVMDGINVETTDDSHHNEQQQST